jgi:hypothetical protein
MFCKLASSYFSPSQFKINCFGNIEDKGNDFISMSIESFMGAGITFTKAQIGV